MTTETVADTFQLEIELPSGYYTCEVEAHSKCYYRPAILGHLPEHCEPAETDQETTFEIHAAQDAAGEPVPLAPELLAALHAALPVEWVEETLWAKFMRGAI